MLRQRGGIARRTRRVRSFGDDAGGRRQTHPGAGSLQSQPETPIPAALAAVEIDETHMQPGRRPDGDMPVCTVRHAGAGVGYSNRLCR